MDNSFSTYILVDNSALESFNAINNVTGWWTKDFTGSSNKLNDEFEVQFGEFHYSKQKLVSFEPGKKVIWLIIESNLSFLNDTSEWNGTRVIFEVSEDAGKTKIQLTHEGLVPAIECYKDCSNAWSQYMRFSLYCLLMKGKGQPGFPPGKPCE